MSSSSATFALKSQEAGVDAVVAEGFEAGGHNGREETTTLTLIPDVVSQCNLPVIAAGGIASGKAMLAAFALGAAGVQIGSRFAVATEFVRTSGIQAKSMGYPGRRNDVSIEENRPDPSH